MVGSKLLTLENVRYIPTLSESIYSLFIHVQLPKHGIQSSFDQGLFLQFPDFTTKAIIGCDDLHLDACPLSDHLTTISSNSTLAPSSTVCRHILDFQEEVTKEQDHLDTLLFSLQQYYDSIKTKRQLRMEMPAGFHHTSNHQKLYHIHHHTSPPPDVDTPLTNLADNVVNTSTNDLVTSFSSLITSDAEENTDNLNTEAPSFDTPIPIIWLVDKLSSSIPKKSQSLKTSSVPAWAFVGLIQ